MPPRGFQQTLDPGAPAGVLQTDPFGLQGFDRRRGFGVHAPRGGVVEVVAQVRADDDEGFVSAPEGLQDFVHLSRRRMADRNRENGKRTKHLLKKRQLHLERVLPVMRIVKNIDEGKPEDLPARGFIDCDGTQGCPKGRATRHREAGERPVVTWPNQHDARNQLPRSFDSYERRGGHLPGVHVACVWHDQRLRPRVRSRRCLARRIEVFPNQGT